MSEVSGTKAHSAPARVPLRATWPPAWLAGMPTMPRNDPPNVRDDNEPAGPAHEPRITGMVESNSAVENPVGEWSLELATLIVWFDANRTHLPSGAFLLRPGCRVVHPHRFYQSIARDIMSGPEGVRARYGLASDLSDLRNSVSSFARVESPTSVADQSNQIF